MEHRKTDQNQASLGITAMRWLLNVLIVIGFCVVTSAAQASSQRCENILSEVISSSVVPTQDSPQGAFKITIPDGVVQYITKVLRATLSGKLATVLRSEWKTKINEYQANEYVQKMLAQYLSPETFVTVMDGLSMQSRDFVKTVHRRLFELQKAEKLNPIMDQISVRDAPAPMGAQDSTFTYYTKSLAGTNSKHQVRVRTYIREVKPREMELKGEVRGFTEDGNSVLIKRLGINQMMETITLKNGQEEQRVWSIDEFVQSSPHRLLYAPHGKAFKLEVKTALEDNILAKFFKKLAGKHMVQKLDITLTPQQVMSLFRPLTAQAPAGKIIESRSRVALIREQLIARGLDENQTRRLDAVLNVLLIGIRENSEFLVLEGATHYQRTAFEARSGFQTTVDSAQVVYDRPYNLLGLMSPQITIQDSRQFVPDEGISRHVELKFPVNAVMEVNGLQTNDPAAIPAGAAVDKASLSWIAQLFSIFVSPTDHAGKYGFLLKNGNHEPEQRDQNFYDGD